MSKSFYNILRECNLDWNKAREIFYNLTDIQIMWLNVMNKLTSRDVKTSNGFTKTFDLRGDRYYGRR